MSNIGATGNVTQQSSLESDSGFTAIIVISTLIVVLAISSTVVIWYCPMFVVRTTSDIIITIRRKTCLFFPFFPSVYFSNFNVFGIKV